MQELDLKKYCEIFKVKKVRVVSDLKNKKTIIYFPVDFISYIGVDGPTSFEKFEAHFDFIANQDVFSVCADDMFWIDEKYKLTDDEEKKALFGKDTKIKQYSSIHARVAAVYSALSEGKIKIREDLDKIED